LDGHDRRLISVQALVISAYSEPNREWEPPNSLQNDMFIKELGETRNGNHNLLVGGSNPPAAAIEINGLLAVQGWRRVVVGRWVVVDRWIVGLHAITPYVAFTVLELVRI
jgi:hypothetical protein